MLQQHIATEGVLLYLTFFGCERDTKKEEKPPHPPATVGTHATVCTQLLWRPYQDGHIEAVCRSLTLAHMFQVLKGTPASIKTILHALGRSVL